MLFWDTLIVHQLLVVSSLIGILFVEFQFRVLLSLVYHAALAGFKTIYFVCLSVQIYCKLIIVKFS